MIQQHILTYNNQLDNNSNFRLFYLQTMFLYKMTNYIRCQITKFQNIYKTIFINYIKFAIFHFQKLN